MEHGGQRRGAGRKKGAGNLLNRELRERINAERLIQFLQDMAEGRIEGASLSERKDAAVALLKKVLPDCRQTEVAQEDDKAFKVIVEDYRSERSI